MDIVTVIGVTGFMLRLGYKLSGLLFLWWRKEYRFDRMLIHIKTRQGKSLITGRTQAGLFFLAALWFITPIGGLTVALLSLYVCVLGISYAKKLRQWLLPPVSPKVMAILVSAIFFGAVSVGFSPLPLLITLAIYDMALLPLSAILVFALSVPTRIYHAWVIHRAVRLLRATPPDRVVGITGSYGKTSVKEYLGAVLSRRYRTLRTEASKNSPIGIAETLMRSFAPGYEAFVVEMGAYKPGEILEMSHMVKPQIGIVTAINPQHQDLFGSIDITMQAKYELLRGLSGRKIAIVNLDDKRTRTMGEWAARDGCTVWGWSTRQPAPRKETDSAEKIFRAEHIRAGIDGIAFDCVLGSTRAHVHAPVVGAHQAGNILAAIAGAVACGMTLEDAAEGATDIRPAKKVMEMKTDENGVIVIDDTFNNNPDAAKAAIAFLGTLKGKKILVFQPMVELGAYAETAHEDVGSFAAAHCDAILLTNTNHYQAVERGVRSISRNIPLLVSTPAQAASYIREHAKRGDAVLFKGKDAEHTLHRISGHTV